MISILIFCHKKKDADTLYQHCGYWMAVMGDECLSAAIYHDDRMLPDMNDDLIISNEVSRTAILPDMIFFELTEEGDFKKLEMLRRRFSESALLVMANPSVSPERYLTPYLCPLTLLFFPVDDEKASETIHQLFIYYYKLREKELNIRRFMVRCGDERRFLDYTQVLFMEAKDKKIYLRYDSEEICFYGSLRNMEASLPGYFVRCHRSYIINSMYISKMNISQGTLCIQNRFVIPFSKKYKNRVDILLDRITR
ncbi:MAG: LytTR family transcriptional regulator DNA-binding domain-containing protein [Clostridiales bacterium]|nr:LytTR family transcriptional regulator DNA-binding domain-containing protein [Clostridiales bacterium]